MARAAILALSWSPDWRGSSGIFKSGLTSKSSKSSATNSTDLFDETSALHSPNGALIGAQGRFASFLRVSLDGRMEDNDGRGGAEQDASLLNCLRYLGMKRTCSAVLYS